MFQIKDRLQSLSLLTLLILQLQLHEEDLVVLLDAETLHHGVVSIDGLLALYICWS